MDIDDSRACVNLFDKGGGSGNISVALDNWHWSSIIRDNYYFDDWYRIPTEGFGWLVASSHKEMNEVHLQGSSDRVD